jgi:hypothetical protein
VPVPGSAAVSETEETMRQNLFIVSGLFRRLENMQYGSPLHQQKLNEAIRELHKCRGLTPYGECPKCKRVGWAAYWPKCPTCNVNVVVDSRKSAAN